MAGGGAQQLSPVCAYVSSRCGSSLSPQQVLRLQEALKRRLLGKTEEDYLRFLKTVEGASELAELMSSIAVHKTDLFRDDVQLRAFREEVLRPLVGQCRRPLHLWSAGCATGEEVATLLILLEEAGADPHSTVLGTDISDQALRQAQTLSFHPYLLKRVPEALRQKYFLERGGRVDLVERLRDRCRFQRHNLMDRPYPLDPPKQGFDVIFCRNVLIYFTEDAFDYVVGELASRLRPGGTLVLSSAEPILKRQPLLSTLRCDQAFFYVRRAAPHVDEAPLPRTLTPPPSTWPTGLHPRPDRARAPAEAPGDPGAQGSRPPLPPQPAPAPPSGAPAFPGRAEEDDPVKEAQRLFELVLEWAAAGDAESQTEQGLRRCLFLDPHFAPARYLLGMLLEQRGDNADAAAEYRRAAGALNERRSRPSEFFLNDDRLKIACERALQRLGFR